MSAKTVERVIALIPTNSLMQIEDMMEDKLDEAIYVLRGTTRISDPSVAEDILPYLKRVKSPSASAFYLKFDRRKDKGSRVNLGMLVRSLLDRKAYDLFLGQIAFEFTYEKAPAYVFMENVPVPPGTKLEADIKQRRKKFLMHHGYEINPSTMQLRMLRFTIARTRRGHLEFHETYNEKFCRWLSMESRGLIGSTKEEELKRSVFRGGEFTFYDGVWKEDFEEG